jgi:hypothetical protein
MDFIENSFGWSLPRTLDRAAKTRTILAFVPGRRVDCLLAFILANR